MKKRKTLRERLEELLAKRRLSVHDVDSCLVAYRAGFKDGKAAAMKACGWGDGKPANRQRRRK